MEIVICAALTGIWWMASATVLLPILLVLKYSKFVRNKWFAFVFNRINKSIFEKNLLVMRKKAFDVLKENLSHRDTSKSLKVLEIGIGGGANLKFYPENCHLTALDINADFEPYYRQNQKNYPQITYDKTVISGAENMEDIDDSSMDVVVSTYVLCSVTSVNDSVKEIKRVLKPGGKFLFLEHVRYPSSDWSLSVQNMASPLWTIYFAGCCITRNIEHDIKNGGFSDVICEKSFLKSLVFFVRPQIYGVATK